MNHRGWGVNRAFTEELDPDVFILQGWSSDQPLDSSMEVIAQMKRVPPIFATDVFDERLDNFTNPHWKSYFQSRRGHVLLRVYPPPPQGTPQYEIFILNGERQVESKFGPFDANPLFT